MGFKKYWSDLHKKHFNTITVNGGNGVVRVSCCRLDKCFLKNHFEPPTDIYNTFFSKINSNANMWLAYSLNWFKMVSKGVKQGF